MIDEVYSGNSAKLISKLRTGQFPDALKQFIISTDNDITSANNALEKMLASSKALAGLRDRLLETQSSKQRLQLLDLSRSLESIFFTAAGAVDEELAALSRRDQLVTLSSVIDALYGTGLISKRQQMATKREQDRLTGTNVDAQTYKQVLDYLSLVPSWGNAKPPPILLRGDDQAERRLNQRRICSYKIFYGGSPMFVFANLIDYLVRDANQAIGVSNILFGKNVGAGLRSLNPGIASGRLYLANPEDTARLDKNGIYLLPETVSELPPVAGILTEGEGNPLSHVQLLARNLGIPNVGVDQSLLSTLRAQENQEVVLAVSPAGSVRLTHTSDPWSKAYLETQRAPEKKLITVDLNKLNVEDTEFATLSELRQMIRVERWDPKAAKLGELKHFYPEAVAEGLAIPFGVFRELVRNTQHQSGVSLFDWMVANYEKTSGITGE